MSSNPGIRVPARYGVYKSRNNFWMVIERHFDINHATYFETIVALKGSHAEACEIVRQKYHTEEVCS